MSQSIHALVDALIKFVYPVQITKRGIASVHTTRLSGLADAGGVKFQLSLAEILTTSMRSITHSQ